MQISVIRDLPFYKGVTSDLQSPQRRTVITRCTYAEGTIVRADGIDLDPSTECSQGIHFCRSVAEALRWGPTVVEITIPRGVKVVDTGGKLRAEKVRAGPVVDLTGAYLIGANLTGAYLTGANLARAYLTDANLTRAHLIGAYLIGADLTRAYLAGANLTRAHLIGAYLTGAYLTGANLTDANLTGADLTRAYLTGANLTGANLTDANLTGAKGNDATTLPDGWRVNRNGLIVGSR